MTVLHPGDRRSTDRDDLVALLRARGEHDLALRAACSLPRHIDPERDAGLLGELGIDPLTREIAAASGDDDRY